MNTDAAGEQGGLTGISRMTRSKPLTMTGLKPDILSGREAEFVWPPGWLTSWNVITESSQSTSGASHHCSW
jgi:hypothetical protein